ITNRLHKAKKEKIKKSSVEQPSQSVTIDTLISQSEQKRFCPYPRDLVGEPNKIS
ncbi:hypothetical protein Avbf_16831, partial [Armadillidium vulgare]